MEQRFLNDIRQNWGAVGRYKVPDELEFELELYKKMLRVFQVGSCYYFVFIPSMSTIDFVSDSVESVLGYSPDEFTTDRFLKSIHPDDLPYFVDYEATVVDFKKSLPPEKLMKYKTRYNYRIRRSDGSYIHILQQSLTIQSDDEGAVLRNFVIHTDISYLKKDNSMSLSFIGLDGEPSYIDVEPRRKFIVSKELLTNRQREVVALICRNKSTKEIANELHISPETVATHRKHIHTKTGTHTVVELAVMAFEHGWL